MNREQLSELLSAYVDGEVTASEKAQVEQVLRSDAGARRLYEEFKRTSAAVAALPRHAAPPGLASDLDSQLERVQLLSGFKGGRNQPTRSAWVTPLRAAAMLMLTVGAGWWFVARQGPTPKTEKVTIVDGADDSARTTRSVAATGVTSASGSVADVETRLAAGEDPVLLVSQPFDPEPIRLTVVAKDTAERDSLYRQLTTQLAQAQTENLAHRKANPSGKGGDIGAFYLEGQLGSNYLDPQQRQVLVRQPIERVESLVDNVSSQVRVPQEQVALRAGPVTAQGPEKSRELIQLLNEKQTDAVAEGKAKPAEEPISAARPSRTLVDTLGEIVGVGPISSMNKAESKTETASADRAESASAKAPPAGAAGHTRPEASGAKEDQGGSLVERRMARARNAGREESDKATHATGSALHAKSATDRFVTMVIEFALPEPKETKENKKPR